MQNVGAAALFIPVVSRISARSGLPMSRLLMPMGFCAILGGTVTMVGSSPLILLNDLILTSNHTLPDDQQMELWSLFSVTPVGIALVATGIIYFVVAGKYVLPKMPSESGAVAATTMGYFQDVYGIDYAMTEVRSPEDSPLAGMMLDEIETKYKIRVIATQRPDGETRVGPGSLARDLALEGKMALCILASPGHFKNFVEENDLTVHDEMEVFKESLATTKAGIAEIVIPPGSNLIGKSARDVWLRKVYGIAMVALHRNGETMREGEGIRDMPLQAGDTLVVHTQWDNLVRLESDRNFVIVTTEFPHENLRPHKLGWAGFFFAVALFLVTFH